MGRLDCIRLEGKGVSVTGAGGGIGRAGGGTLLLLCPIGTETPLLREMIAGLEERQAVATLATAQVQTPQSTSSEPATPQPQTPQVDAGLVAGKPVQRWLRQRPDEVAAALTWLTSPAGAMVAGSSISLDFGSV
jgi:hypothetical protein